jgi:hypothetical protein
MVLINFNIIIYQTEARVVNRAKYQMAMLPPLISNVFKFVRVIIKQHPLPNTLSEAFEKNTHLPFS